MLSWAITFLVIALIVLAVLAFFMGRRAPHA